jgi:hypothetical protein
MAYPRPAYEGARKELPPGDPEFNSDDCEAMITLLNCPLGARVALFHQEDDQVSTFADDDKMFIGVIRDLKVEFFGDAAVYDGTFTVRIRGKHLNPYEVKFDLTPLQQSVTIDVLSIRDWIQSADLEVFKEAEVYKFNHGVTMNDYADLADFIIRERNEWDS